MSWINIKIWTISTKFHYPYEWIFGAWSWPTYIIKEATWNWYINLTNAVANHLMELKAYGWIEQNWTPTPTIPVDIVSNNWTIKFSRNMANINEQTIQLWYYISTQWVITADPNNRIYKEYISVQPNTTYTLSLSSSVYFVSISEYSTAEDSGFVVRKAGSTGSNTKLTITTGATTNYVRFWTNIDRTEITLEEVLAINWQLEEWDTPTQYKPYVEWGIYVEWTTETIEDELWNTATAEMLLKIWDYVDEQEILSWDIVRKIWIKVLDWTETRWEKDGYWRVQLTVSNLPTWDITRKIAAYCTHFKNLHNSEPIWNVVPWQFYVWNPQSFYFHILESNVAWFKTWLASQYAAWTPVIVVYPLATSTTESVTGQTMNIQAWSDTIEITQASIDNLWLYAKYKATA